MATVSEHLEHFAALVKQGVDPDLGCAALLQVFTGDELGDSMWTTGLVRPEEGLSEVDNLRDDTWEYKDGALHGGWEDAKKLLDRVLPTSEVHLLMKQAGATNNPSKVFIGRGKQNDVLIRHETVSSIHLQVEPLDDDRVIAVDCRSSNGTYLNGRVLEPNKQEILRSGDCLRIGQCTYYFLGRNSLRVFLKLRLAEALKKEAAANAAASAPKTMAAAAQAAASEAADPAPPVPGSRPDTQS